MLKGAIAASAAGIKHSRGLEKMGLLSNLLNDNSGKKAAGSVDHNSSAWLFAGGRLG